jgi:O-antigen/teichoic acid export membrane protein
MKSETESPLAATPGLRRGSLPHNTLHLVLGQVFTTALTIVLSSAIAGGLGPSEFGLWYLVSSVVTFTFVFVDWGHGPYVIREVARRPDRAGELLGTVMWLRIITVVALAGPAFLTARLLGYDERADVFIVGMLLASVPTYMALTYGWAFRGSERMEFDALVNVLLKFLMMACGVGVLYLGGRMTSLIGAVGVAGTATFVAATLLYRHLGFPKLHASRAVARELIVGGAPLVSMTIAVAVQPYIDANVLSRLTPTSVLGWYGAAMTFCSTLVAPAAILSTAAYPRLSIVAGESGRFAAVLREALRPLLFLAVLGGVGTYLFAGAAIGIVYRIEDYAPSVSILRAFTPAMVLVFVDMMFATAIVASGRAGHLAAAKVGSVVVITGLELILVPLCQTRYGNGGLGIMFAFAGGEILTILASLYLLPRGTLTRAIGLDAARAVAAGLATFLIARAFVPASLIGIPVCVIVFTLCATAVGLISRRDIDQLMRIVGRRGTVSSEGVAALASDKGAIITAPTTTIERANEG